MKHLLLLFPLCLAHLASTLDDGPQSPPPVLAPKPDSPTPSAPSAKCRRSPPTPPNWRATRPEKTKPNNAPERLPVPEEVTPLPLGSLDTKAASPLRDDPAVGDMVEKYLSDLSLEEQRIWKEELQGLPIEVIKELLTAKERSSDTLLFDPAKIFAPSSVPTTPPIQSEPSGETFGPSVRMHAPDTATDSTRDLLRKAESMIRHNIANTNTVAYKRILPFTEGASDAAGLAALTPRRIQSQGEFYETGRPLDCFLDGPGFFQIEREGRLAITRRGILEVNDSRYLATSVARQEWRLHPPIELPINTSILHIDDTGQVFATQDDDQSPNASPTSILLGQLELVRPHDWEHWELVSEGVWEVPSPSPPLSRGLPGQKGLATLRSGGLENSNVDLEAELLALRRLRSQIETLSPSPGAPIDEQWVESPQPSQQLGLTTEKPPGAAPARFPE